MIIKLTRDGPGGPRVLRLARRRPNGTWVRAQVGVEFKPQDFWVGAYWESHRLQVGESSRVDVWVCFLPMLPLHIRMVVR